jgi:hypothetical protein
MARQSSTRRRLVRHEREYFFTRGGRPLGFPSAAIPLRKPYYTGVGWECWRRRPQMVGIWPPPRRQHQPEASAPKWQLPWERFSERLKATDEMWITLRCYLTEKYGVDIDSTASRSATPTGTAPACMQLCKPPHARSRRREYSEASLVSGQPRRPHCGLQSGQPRADRQARLLRSRISPMLSRTAAPSIRDAASFINNGYRAIWRTAARTRRRPYQIAPRY